MSGVRYDGAGQIISDGRFRQMQYGYDGNGRVKWSAKLDGTYAATSVSDGLGQRVQTTQAGGVSRRFIYDIYGRVAAEYEGTTLKRLNVYAGASSQLIAVDEMLAGGEREAKYVVADRQGSTRAVLDANGAVISRHDYLPFGEEVGAGTGMRTTAQGYGASDNVRQRYAGTERDEASGLEHTLWRKLDAVSGRWTTPDPYGESMRFSDPQSFNRYAYVHNDPINFVDPTGLDRINIGSFDFGTIIGSIDSAVRGGTLSSLAGLVSGRDGSLLDELPPGEVGGDPPNPAPNVDDLRNRVAKMVSNPACSKFISDLINGTATDKNPAAFTDALKGFNMIASQQGFVYGDTIRRTYGYDGHTVHGTIGAGNAQVELSPPRTWNGPNNPSAAAGFADTQAMLQAMGTLHEVLHLAGRNGWYGDFEYAKTVANMRGIKAPDFANIRAASEYWNNALETACKPR